MGLHILTYFILQGWINLIKCDSKGVYNGIRDFISNKCCSVELSIHQSMLKNNRQKNLMSTHFFNIDNN